LRAGLSVPVKPEIRRSIVSSDPARSPDWRCEVSFAAVKVTASNRNVPAICQENTKRKREFMSLRESNGRAVFQLARAYQNRSRKRATRKTSGKSLKRIPIDGRPEEPCR